MNRTAVTWSIALALAVATAPWARAHLDELPDKAPSVRGITLQVSGAAPAEVAQRLGELLGTEVRLEGALPQKISVSLKDLPVAAALDRVAATVAGQWERIYRFAPPGNLAQGDRISSGLNVTLRMTDVPCVTAAGVVARMTRARIEVDGELTGTVTLVGTEMPVEETLDTIARAAGMEWRTQYVIRGRYDVRAPNREPVAAGPKPAATEPDAGASDGTPLKRYRPNAKQKRRARTKYTVIGPLGAPTPPPLPPPDVQRLEELSRLGQFQGIFAIEDEAERKLQVKRFITGMESQARKLENFEPRQRLAALRVLSIHLQQYLLDVDTLNDAQKKEVEPLIEYIKKRLAEINTALGGR